MPKVKKAKNDGREVVYGEVTANVCLDDSAITVEDAKELLGWVEESEQDKFGSDFLLKDERGVKIRCTSNVTNRPLNPSNVKLLAKEILLGNWVFNGEPIIVGETGLMLNGQHTLIGLIIAAQLWEEDKQRWNYWKKEPTIDKMIVSGVDESDKTVNTMDTCKPRALWEVICRSDHFVDLSMGDRRKCSRYAESACKLLKSRVGADLNAFMPRWTHAEYLDFISRHPKLLECIKHIHEENGEEKRISQFLSPGYAAGFLYLMGSSATDAGDYRSAESPHEKLLDWSRWDQASNFFVLIAGHATEVDAYRSHWASMVEEDKVSNAERWATLSNAWCSFLEHGHVKKEDLALEYAKDDDGYSILIETPMVGGIDLGNPKEADEEQVAATDPSPEEIRQRKQKAKESKKSKAKTNPLPVLRPNKTSTEWDVGDVAWIKDEDEEHYFGEVISESWKTSTNKSMIDVRTASGEEWEVLLSDLSLTPPEKEKKIPPKPDALKPKGNWAVGNTVWVREKGGEDWRGKITDFKSSNSAVVKVANGFQGAGNTKTVWTKNLSKKQSQPA